MGWNPRAQTEVTVDFQETAEGNLMWDVRVPTETGSVCAIYFEHALRRGFGQDSYSMEFSGELLDQSPEALAAATQMALLALRESR